MPQIEDVLNAGTAPLGIGVLSYFMLADRVEIRTRRSFEHGDAEPHGWEFQTEGWGLSENSGRGP